MLRQYSPMQGPVFRRVPCTRVPSYVFKSFSPRLPWSRVVSCSSPTVNGGSTGSVTAKDPYPNLPPLPSENIRFQPEKTSDDLLGVSSTGKETFDNGSRRFGPGFRSVGSRSQPSIPSIPGKFSKYSKPIGRFHLPAGQQREERRDRKAFRKPMGNIAANPDPNLAAPETSSSDSNPFAVYVNKASSVDMVKQKISSSPVPLEELPEWMQMYQHSYSEAPRAPILGFRETPWSPFGPQDMELRPWTGRAPLSPSKKKRPEFDSFNPPPLNKKGVKYVQRPGPFPPGEGPKPGKTREEILGAPLTSYEIKHIVEVINKGSKQLNLGRDGLTHNMLDVIHSHWKRSICCKIKCKGVPTIDMDNVARVVEEKTGGVIIHRSGGVIYLFRGRNYNYKDRPKIPIMLWKPPAPIYPRLIKPIPEGLTEDEVNKLRAKGRKVIPLCKLSKNGVYLNLVQDVRAQFEIDEVVRVDCTGLNPSDYRKIGAKLRDLVPCVLLSFEKEQVIMYRGKPSAENGQPIPNGDASTKLSNAKDDTGMLVSEEPMAGGGDYERDLSLTEGAKLGTDGNLDGSTSDFLVNNEEDAASARDVITEAESLVADGDIEDAFLNLGADGEETTSAMNADIHDLSSVESASPQKLTSISDRNSMDEMSEVDLLWQQAIDEGKALVLEKSISDPDTILQKATELSQVQASCTEQVAFENNRLEKERVAEVVDTPQVPATSPFDVPPRGTLQVDELAKLLAP